MIKPDNLLKDLNPAQQKAVCHKGGPALIFAGAGSGKTRALTYRAAYLITQGIRPENILLVTFTNKAAHEMKSRLARLLAGGPSLLPPAGTFHAWCAKLLHREAGAAGLSPSFVIFDEKDQLETVKEAMTKLNLSPKQVNPRAVLTTISEAKNELISHLEYPRYAKGYFQKTVADIYLAYQKLLRDYQAVDFDDLLMASVRLFQNQPEIQNRYAHQYQHVLVDEYQDTNQAQYQLTKLLAKRWRNLFVVGDCSQSIYSWRGADFRNVIRLKEDYPDLATYYLEQNYRSGSNILQAAFGIIRQNTSHPILKLWTDRPSGENITLYQAENEKDEADFVVRQIRERLKQPSLDFASFAVLFRTNAQSRILEEAFLHQGIPYELVGLTRFYDRKEIKDCLAYLRLAANPKDGISRKRVLGLGKKRAAKFFAWQEKTKNQKQNTKNILDQILKITGYLDQFDPKNKEDLSRLENIRELRSVAVEFPDLSAFLENVALVEQESLPDKNLAQGKKNKVHLLTLHAAKGLEFPYVFMTGMEEGLFPHSRSLMDKHEIEEERRLCYVGITRTREKLYLTFCERRLFFGTRMYNMVSRFINDLPENLLDVQIHPN